MRRVLAVLLAGVVGLAGAAERADALDVGMSDQHANAFPDPRLRALALIDARLVVPWNAAATEPAAVQSWLDAVAAAKMTPHIAFEHARGTNCPSSPCALPTRAQYAAAVRAFIARFPQVRTYTTWNEANHEVQPTATAPEAAAGFYQELVAACPGCTVVAGDVIDSGSYVQWLRRFQAALPQPPQLWGLHNYTDVTFGTTSGTDAALAAVPGDLWVEETGGIVVRRDRAGRQLLAYDEARAARSIDQAFTIAATRPRIKRLYIYQWRAGAQDLFDAGLVRPDGVLRPSYDALVRNLAAIRPAPVAAAPAHTRWTARWAKKRRGRLVLRGTCRLAGGRCSGTVSISLRTLTKRTHKGRSYRVGTRRFSTTARHKTVQITVRISSKLRLRARSAARRSVALSVRDGGPAARTVVMTVSRPR